LSVRRILAIVFLAALAGCSQPPAPPHPVASTPQLIDPDAACLQDLQRLQVSFQPMQSFRSEDGCGIANPVRVSGGAIAWNRPGTMSCALARTLVRFEAEVVQPLAHQHFGQPVKRIHHAGSYDCRVRRTDSTKVAARVGRSKGGRLSEHAKGMALDVLAFELNDGRMVSLKRHWRGAGSSSAFLQEVGRASCSVFNVVLTPNHDRSHQDHFHLDIGPYTLCGL
jgi:hypothetical protein